MNLLAAARVSNYTIKMKGETLDKVKGDLLLINNIASRQKRIAAAMIHQDLIKEMA